MHLPTLIDRCTEITQSKGFDVSRNLTQLCLMATEIAEAMEWVSPSNNFTTDAFAKSLRMYARDYERYRQVIEYKSEDDSSIIERKYFLTELSDTVIRICSYVGGNGWKDEFIKALAEKIEKNAERPYKHGKGF